MISNDNNLYLKGELEYKFTTIINNTLGSISEDGVLMVSTTYGNNIKINNNNIIIIINFN